MYRFRKAAGPKGLGSSNLPLSAKIENNIFAYLKHLPILILDTVVQT